MSEPKSFGEYLALSDEEKLQLVSKSSKQAALEQVAREWLFAHFRDLARAAFTEKDVQDLVTLLAAIRRATLEEAAADYRDRIARKLQLDHMARQQYSKTDIIIALDQVDDDMDKAKEGA
jgi:hypothetical protein